jgi:hypothetical protein
MRSVVVRIGNGARWEHRVQFLFDHELENRPVVSPPVVAYLLSSPYMAVSVKVSTYIYMEGAICFSSGFLDDILNERQSCLWMECYSTPVDTSVLNSSGVDSSRGWSGVE